MTTTLTHKIRNPKQLQNWLELWTANVDDENNYTIIPSENWNFPISVSSLSTARGDVATYEKRNECLILDVDQILTDATLSAVQENGRTIYSLSTQKGNIASYDENENCLSLSQALISAILTS